MDRPKRPMRPTAAELERNPTLLWHWMDDYCGYCLLEGALELLAEQKAAEKAKRE